MAGGAGLNAIELSLTGGERSCLRALVAGAGFFFEHQATGPPTDRVVT
jgi:hypothetical protein